MWDFNKTQSLITNNIDSIFINIVSNTLFSLFTVLITLTIGLYFYNRIIKKENQVEFQTYISGESSHIVCKEDSYFVKDIPNILLQYRKKMKTTNDEEELYFWKTRVSTFTIFTDGKKILLNNRKEFKNNKTIFNPKLDAFGAKKFHNSSLKCKLSKQFMESKIIKMESISGIVIENNRGFIRFLKKNDETVIMIGFIAYVDSNDLKKGIEFSKVQYDDCTNNDVDRDTNIISPLSCLSPDDENLTAKAKLGIKYLQSKVVVENDDFISCKKEEFQNEGIEPSLFYHKDEVIEDNLKEINGIGIKIEESLNEIGIFTFKQITEWSEDNIAWIDNQLPFKRRVVKKEWIKEAERLFNSQNKETHA